MLRKLKKLIILYAFGRITLHNNLLQVNQLFSFSAGALSSEPIFTFNYDYNVNAGSTIFIDKISVEEFTAPEPASVPEPNILLLFGMGFTGLLGTRLIRKKQ